MVVRALTAALEAGIRLRGARRRSLETEGQTFSYLEAGARRRGIPIVLVHGLGTSNLSWVRAIPLLARRYRVLAPDLPGFGKSPLPHRRPFATIPEHAKALAAFLQSDVVGGPCLVVGQSMGGWVAIKTARLVPERVDQLVLVNSAGILYEGIEDLRTIVTPRNREEVYAFWKRAYYKIPWYYRLFWREAAQNMRTSSVLKLLDALEKPDFVNDDLGHLEMPVSIVWGRADRFIPAENVDLLVAGLGSTRVSWIAKCGHVPAMERPKEFVAALTAIADATARSRPRPPVGAKRRLRVPAARAKR